MSFRILRRLHIFKRRIFITKSRLFQRLSNAEMAWEGSLKLAFTLTFLLVPTWTVAQQTNSDNSGWLFPSDSDLVSAARYGYQGEGNLDLDYAYVKREFDLSLACLPGTQTIRVAGPLMLAAQQGQAAHLNSKPEPVAEDLLHVKGGLVLQLFLYSHRKEDRAEIWLTQGTQEFHPDSVKVDMVETFTCGPTFSVGSGVYTSNFVWHVVERFAFRFTAAARQPDWNEPIELFVRVTKGKEERYEVKLGRSFASQAHRLHPT